MNIQNYYVPFDTIRTELEARWNNASLKAKVEEFLGPDFPRALREATGPSAVTVRCIATPDNEFLHFLQTAEELATRPVFLEYTKDKFVAKNEDKYALCKLHFFSETATDLKQCPSVRIVDFNRYEGKAFSEIKTITGEALVDFHHDLLREHLGPRMNGLSIEDFSDWFNRTRFASDYYYLYYLSLFVCHGVLFENLLMSDGERAFTEEKILPSFKQIEELFGVRPLIYPITPVESEDDFRWWTYPADVRMIVTKKLGLASDKRT